MVDQAVKDPINIDIHDRLPRTKLGRSQTTVPASTSGSQSRSGVGRRSRSQDSVLQAANALEQPNPTNIRAKKGSIHADVIDQLDFSGVGPTFHHDGPFDACTPSRNRHRTKAPMLAWSSMTHPPNSRESPPSTHFGSQSKKNIDAIAEAWGIHEPEPYEEFFAGGASARYDNDNPSSTISTSNDDHRRGKRNVNDRDLHDSYKQYIAPQTKVHGHSPTADSPVSRCPLPPPQPIPVPEWGQLVAQGPRLSPKTAAPKRNNSFMHRIRTMRDAQNVPAGQDDLGVSPQKSSTHIIPNNLSERISTHHRDSLRGRLPGDTSSRLGSDNIASPMSENLDIYFRGTPSGESRRDKNLPAPPFPVSSPRDHSSNGLHDDPFGSSGLGRKASLLKKMRDAVRGNK